MIEHYCFFLQAKQRSTIKWLLSKAYNNRIPENIIEPFYKDHDVSIKSNPMSCVFLIYNFKC